MKRIGKTIGILLLLGVFGAAGWYFASPLFLNRIVDEALPFDLPQFPADDEIGTIMPPTAVTVGESIVKEVVTKEALASDIVTETTASEEITSTEAITETATGATAEDAPTNTPTILSQGNFVDGDNFHKGSGTATLYAAPDGTYLLRFDEFTVTNGPDLRVLLSPTATPTDPADLGDYLELGALKGNIGAQNYTLPADLDPTRYKSVIIYCLPFQVIFATATLE